MSATTELDARLDAIAQHPFRAKFHLRGKELAMVRQRGERTIRRHAAELIARRLAPAQPRKDGRQTPWRGHPVFVAQHATGTCCRSCLERFHGIGKGHALSEDERTRVVDVICRWIEREAAAASRPTR
jgi:hypothetical protein